MKTHNRHLHIVVVSLQVDYTPNYPDELPDLQVEPLEGELTEEETEHLLEGMRAEGSESLGMAMVFTLTTWLKEALVDVLEDRSRKLKEAEDKRHAEYEEVSHFCKTPHSQSFHALTTTYRPKLHGNEERRSHQKPSWHCRKGWQTKRIVERRKQRKSGYVHSRQKSEKSTKRFSCGRPVCSSHIASLLGADMDRCSQVDNCSKQARHRRKPIWNTMTMRVESSPTIVIVGRRGTAQDSSKRKSRIGVEHPLSITTAIEHVANRCPVVMHCLRRTLVHHDKRHSKILRASRALLRTACSASVPHSCSPVLLPNRPCSIWRSASSCDKTTQFQHVRGSSLYQRTRAGFV